MREITGDIWDYHSQGHWIVITTNGTVKSNGEAVMGRGVALQARQRFPSLPKELGGFLRYGNLPLVSNSRRIITFPVKYHWRDKADLVLIEQSCQRVRNEWLGQHGLLYMVRPGCGNGQLDWKDVKPILEKYLDDWFVVVNNE